MSFPARIRASLSAEGYLFRQLLAGVVAILGASLVVGYLATNIGAGEPLTLLDARIVLWFHRHARQPVTEIMLAVSLLNGYVGIPVLSALFAIVLARRREWQWMAFTLIAVGGGMVLNVLAKLAFARQRPSFGDPLVMLSTFSFPSGHTVASTLFYGTIAAFLTPRVRWAVRPWLWIGALLMVTLVAFSRVYLGAHYLTDVVAGFAEGVAWLACCMVAWSTYLWRSHRGTLATTAAAR
jgi:membrane-associated phospholipid phosphatase